MTKLWPSDLFVDAEASLNNVIRKIRAVLGDSPEKPRFLETVIGKGYRFIGPIRVINAGFAPSAFEHTPAPNARIWRVPDRNERPTLAVLPLCLLGNILDDKGVCLGFADALISRLGNMKDIDVLPTSAMLNVPAEMSPSDVGSNLGVRFVVHGAIRESKGQWRLALEMFDTHLQGAGFSRKLDLDLNRLPQLEDEIAKQIATALNRPLRPEATQSQRYSNDQLAYAEFVRGYRLSSSGDPALFEEAVQRLSKALTRDPGFLSLTRLSPLPARLAILRPNRPTNGWKWLSFIAEDPLN